MSHEMSWLGRLLLFKWVGINIDNGWKLKLKTKKFHSEKRLAKLRVKEEMRWRKEEMTEEDPMQRVYDDWRLGEIADHFSLPRNRTYHLNDCNNSTTNFSSNYCHYCNHNPHHEASPHLSQFF